MLAFQGDDRRGIVGILCCVPIMRRERVKQLKDCICTSSSQKNKFEWNWLFGIDVRPVLSCNTSFKICCDASFTSVHPIVGLFEPKPAKLFGILFRRLCLISGYHLG